MLHFYTPQKYQVGLRTVEKKLERAEMDGQNHTKIYLPLQKVNADNHILSQTSWTWTLTLFVELTLHSRLCSLKPWMTVL